MRNRHIPRLCHHCSAPMARQEASCWSCGTRYDEEPAAPAQPTPLAGPDARPELPVAA